MTSNELFEDILPLAPLQEGMLFHATYDRDALDVYTVRLAIDFEGPFDLDVFRDAVRALLIRRGNLRAGFLSENLSRPVQVVPRKFDTPVVVHDLSGLEETERAARLAELDAADQNVRFDLTDPPLLRFTVVRLAEREWRLMFACHHILLDGWSMPIVLGELFALYTSGGDTSALPPAAPFKLYLAWLRKQDKQASLDAWRAALDGLGGPTLVAPDADDSVAALPGRITTDLPADTSARLAALARRLGVTVNTAVQAAWGLLLARLTGTEDVVFGATVSGRPPEIEGVETMVGLFINTVPVRVRLGAGETLRDLLLRLQDEQSALLDHHYVGLTEVQRAAGHGRLFDSLVAFESYPVDADSLQSSIGDLTVTGVSGDDATHYPLTLIVVPGERVQLRLGYQGGLFTEDTAAGLLAGLEHLLGTVADDDTRPAAEALTSLALPDGWTVTAPAREETAGGGSVTDLTVVSGEGRAPRTPHEEVLCGLFAEALGVPSVSIDDNFFDLGGHSLLATRLVSRVRNVFEIELPVRALFDAQTVAALAEKVVDSSTGGRPPVRPAQRPERVPLSFAQRRLWFLNRMEGPSGTYNIPLAVRLSGTLDVPALRSALVDVVERHESLRTVFPDVDGEPWQQIVPAADVDLPFRVVEVTEDALEGALASAASAGFDLAAELPVRAWLFRVSGTEHVLCVVVHHIAGDGWSQAPLARDLGAAYRARVAGAAPAWEPLPVQYADFALWQRDVLGGEEDENSPIAGQLAYWRGVLDGLPDELSLPVDRVRPPVASYRGGLVQVELGARLHRDLVGLARSTRSSLFMVLQAGVAGLLSRLGAGTDVPLGTAIAGRTDAALDDLVGFFVNTLVLRTDVSGDPGLRELVERVRVTDLAAYAHQDLPFEQLVHALQPARSLARHPLFQVMIVLQNNAEASLDLPGLSARPIDGEIGAAKFDLGFNFIERKDATGAPAGVEVTVEYSADLFDEDTVAVLARRLVRMLTLAVADPAMPLSRLDLLEPREWQQLLPARRGTEPADRPERHETVPSLFAAQVARTPDRPAVVAEDAELTYAELDERSGRLAALLAARGVRRGDVVAVAVPRSAALTVAHLAVLRTGAVCLPVAPDDPAERIARVLRDTGPVVVLTTRQAAAGLPATAETVLIDAPDSETTATAVPADAALPDAPAYLIRATGPTTVAVPHRGIVSWLLWMRDTYRLGADDRVLHKAPEDLDVSVWEQFAPLVAGAAQVVAGPGSHRDPVRLARLIHRADVTTVHFTPSVLEVFLAEAEAARCTGLRRVLCSGEPLPTGLRDRFRALTTGAELHVLHGPTEASCAALAWNGTTEADYAYPPAGRPVGTTRAYVLDAHLAPLPVGSSGELYVGGEQLAHGYLGRPDLTAERFVADPYGPPGARLHRTGDLARVTRDGTIELLGRTDDRITVGGRSVEPGEIEQVLAGHPAVGTVVVTDRPGPTGATALVAYVVPADPAVAVDADALRAHAATVLPDHAVPAHCVTLDAVPRTADGRVDRAALPEPHESAGRAPRNDIEQTLCGLFADLLGKPVTSIDDSFFDLGGHSLLATRLVSRVRSTFGIELPFRDIFDAQTVAALAERVVGSSTGGRPPVRAVAERPEQVPLAFAQRRLWFLNRMEGPSGTYNVPLAVRLSGALDVPALTAAFNDVVARHEALRTVFPETDGEPWQRIVPAAEATVSVEVTEVTEEGLEAALASAASQGFDLTVDLPVRASLLRVTDTEHVLCVVMHHIAGDGWSQAPLARDLAAAYRARLDGATPGWEPLPVQYADFALWQRDVLGGEEDENSPIAGQLAYWRGVLDGLPDELPLPVDRVRPAVASYRGGVVSVELDARLHRDLVGLARSTRSSLFMVLQAGVAGLLSRLGAGTDVPLGTAIAGRTDAALDDLVGFFVNTLVLRTDVSGDPGLRELVERVRVTDLAAYAHQDLPFEQLVHALQPARSLARHPLFQVMIVLQNNAEASLDLPGLSARPIDGETAAAKFDLGFNFVERTDLDGAPAGIDVSIEYSADLFDADTVRLIGERLGRLLTTGVAEPATPLTRIGILAPDEQERLLTGFNDTARTLELPPATESGFAPETLAGLFAAQAARTPDRPALVAEDAELTYAELDERSGRLAALLAARGVRRGDVVAVAVPRSAALTVALLAALKAGAAYLPVETDYPAERIAYVLGDARPAVLVTTVDALGALPEDTEGTVRSLVVLDDLGLERELADVSADAVRELPGPLPDSPAYLIYTSGSTGRPKGVVVPHRGIVNRLLWMQDAYRLGADDRVLQKTPSGFDVSVWEFFWPLVTGAVQVAARPGGHRDPAYLARLIQDAGITTVHFVPSMLEVFLAEPGAAHCTGLRRVLCSGEALPAGLRDRFRALLGAGLHNLYGPTEASVDVTAWDCATAPDSPVVPIGRPIWNTRTYVLDAALTPVPAGSSGELYLGGVQLAHGYLGRPDLTAERFVADPFGPPGARLYRTGDLARITRDGVIEFLGRTDDQVKIRGQRIELGEIEHALTRHARVGSAVVTAYRDPSGDTRLAAYVTCADPAAPVDPEELRDHLATLLPDHMVPLHYAVIDAVPVTPNGKVDKKALPAPQRLERRPGRAPRDETETVLCEIFAELLGHDSVDIDDNFFELGGHSLLATKLISRVRARLGLEMSVVSIFEAPTVAALAVRLGQDAAAGPTSPLLTLRPGGDRAPLFCVHPLGGLSWPYAGLGEHLPADVGLYGLQAVGLDGDDPLPGSLEEMAADYVARIRAVQPEGPYRLLGWSLGGRIAHAMAVLLEAAGQEVELLALLDAYPNTGTGTATEFSEEEFLTGVLSAAGLDAAELAGPVDIPTVMAAVRSTGNDLAGLTEDQLRRLQRVMANSFRVDGAALTGRCRAGALMFAATVDPAGDPDRWLHHVDGGLETHAVAVSHNDLMRPEPLAEIGAVLAKKLARTDPA
ncbi:non-ribosomal peptide synthetase [Streptomyces sp. DH24]|uniref:non-ribosomal peptide synthetase n=1 Tax=Streptomyces sp. DH24 TaxID=3040123 RepID=UPI002442F7A7|nr:non-ribosomal peptide synthetase [Streptomyces sp. DH24]MDG9720864.1 amino acid adenylation domain-containing protein [Streptomyces sp. DH24]